MKSVKIPNTTNGIKNPTAYTPTNTLPSNAVFAPDAIINTEDNIGPTQGVQAKLKVNPIKSATSGPTFPVPHNGLIRLSRFRKSL